MLLLAFLATVAYAAPLIYQWTRAAARMLPAVGGVEPYPSTEVVSAPVRVSEQSQLRLLPPPASSHPSPPVTLKPGVLRDSPSQPQRISVLVLGVDRRPDDPSPPRTDNMMVVTYDFASGRLGLISLARDTYVPIPDFDRYAKINSAYVIGESNDYPGGGGALAKKTVSEFLGYPIDYYVTINFEGFVRFIDLIGGIDVNVPKTIHDERYPTEDYGYTTFHIDAGWQHLDGETALKYVRTRNADSDFQRARRQQQVLLAVKDKLLKNKLLTTLRLREILNIMSDSVRHDIPTARLLELASLASKVQINGIDQLVLDDRYGVVDADSPYGWILIPDREKIRPAVDRLFAKAEAPQRAQVDVQALVRQQLQQQAESARQQIRNDYHAQAELLRQRLAAEGARIVVYDGTGDPTMAARTAQWLRHQGYNVVGFGQADRSDYPRTVLLTYSDKPFTIARLRESFAIADENLRQSNNLDSDVDLRLIIGRDFYLLVSN